MIRTPTNYDESQEESGSDRNLELKGGVDSKLPKVTGVTNSLKGLADAVLDEKGTAGYNTRSLATKADVGSHITLDATATSREEHGDDRVGGGDEEGMAIQGELSRVGVGPDAVGINDPTNRYNHCQV